MLTLCHLATPMAISAPASPALRPFKFFMTRSRGGDGRELFRLHMGYFACFSEAERWAQALRVRYPHAVAARVPHGMVVHAGSEASVPSLVDGGQSLPTSSRRDDQSSASKTLSDTQVLRVLEARRFTAAEGERAHAIEHSIAALDRTAS